MKNERGVKLTCINCQFSVQNSTLWASVFENQILKTYWATTYSVWQYCIQTRRNCFSKLKHMSPLQFVLYNPVCLEDGNKSKEKKNIG